MLVKLLWVDDSITIATACPICAKRLGMGRVATAIRPPLSLHRHPTFIYYVGTQGKQEMFCSLNNVESYATSNHLY